MSYWLQAVWVRQRALGLTLQSALQPALAVSMALRLPGELAE